MKLEVGKTYTSNNDFNWECIVVTDTHAWMKSSNHSTAYVWTHDGVSVSLDESYNLNLSPREYWIVGDHNKELYAMDHKPECKWDIVIHVSEVMPE